MLKKKKKTWRRTREEKKSARITFRRKKGPPGIDGAGSRAAHGDDAGKSQFSVGLRGTTSSS